jgi:hypothetical protein
MALILIRAENQKKILNSLADIERHADLKITGKPRIVNPESADRIAQEIIKQKLRSKSKIAVIVKVKDDTTKSIVHIRKIHPPAHLMVISEEYKEFKDIERNFKSSPVLQGYYSHKKGKTKSKN